MRLGMACYSGHEISLGNLYFYQWEENKLRKWGMLSLAAQNDINLRGASTSFNCTNLNRPKDDNINECHYAGDSKGNLRSAGMVTTDGCQSSLALLIALFAWETFQVSAVPLMLFEAI